MTFEEYERAVMAKALELTRGASFEFNIVPTLEIVRCAWNMGYDLVKRDGSPPVQS